MSHAIRALALVMVASLLVIGSGTTVGNTAAGPWEETRFQTGCDPGPYHSPPPPNCVSSM